MSKTKGRSTLIQRSRDVKPSEKALFHNVSGAGRSKVKREFFNLDASDVGALRDELERRVTKNLQKQG